MGSVYRFESELFVSSPEASWVFAALPPDVADEIVDAVPRRRGFGSVRVAVGIASSEWETSIFPSTQMRTYLLPVKRSIREREHVDVGDTVAITLEVIDG